jgi:hypothetical protein
MKDSLFNYYCLNFKAGERQWKELPWGQETCVTLSVSFNFFRYDIRARREWEVRTVEKF